MSLDAYEYVGVAVPGAVPTLAATILIPELRALIGVAGVELGGLGLFLIISFVIGHGVQSLGNLIEWAEGLCGKGFRSLPFRKDRGGVKEAQWRRFLFACERQLGVRPDEVSEDTWSGIRTEVIARLSDANTRRVEAFNRTYGLCRGLCAGFLLASLMTVMVEGVPAWPAAIALLGGAVIMFLRKRRFGRHYLQEVIARFLAFDAATMLVSVPQEASVS